jgi:hypothetical protein
MNFSEEPEPREITTPSLILDVIGAGILAAALIIALWRRAARQRNMERF